MSVKQEHKDGEGITRPLEATFDSYLQGISKGFWYLDNAIPTLKDVRGKIVLLRRFENYTKGIDANPWQDDATFSIPPDENTKSIPNGRLKVQDRYNVKSLVPLPDVFDVNKKWNAIKDLLDEARDDKSKDNWYINFTSGSSPLAYPDAIAGRINHRVSAYVEDESLSNVRLGTIVTDFPDDDGKTDMVDRIIKVNFR
jgi:1-phosphatidylinositol phosphodiesterase